jgi:uncharacterized protein YeeX (DUF496 family)
MYAAKSNARGQASLSVRKTAQSTCPAARAAVHQVILRMKSDLEERLNFSWAKKLTMNKWLPQISPKIKAFVAGLPEEG